MDDSDRKTPTQRYARDDTVSGGFAMSRMGTKKRKRVVVPTRSQSSNSTHDMRGKQPLADICDLRQMKDETMPSNADFRRNHARITKLKPDQRQYSKAMPELVNASSFRSNKSVRTYDVPTVTSKMKKQYPIYRNLPQSNCYFNSIPFVASKCSHSAKSHHIGINIQQVLSGMKMQRPLTGIPPSMAFHMGLRRNNYTGQCHKYAMRKSLYLPECDTNELNLGQGRVLKLPSIKYMSYDKMMKVLKQGDGPISKYLRSVHTPSSLAELGELPVGKHFVLDYTSEEDETFDRTSTIRGEYI